MGVTKSLDVTATQQQIILTLLNKYLPNTTTWAYGSRVKWTARPSSDLDLVIFATPEQTADIALLREAFEESDLPFRVDLFNWDDVPQQFKTNIKADYLVIQSGENDKNTIQKSDEFQQTTLGEIVSKGKGFIQTGPFGSQLHASDYVNDGIPCIMPINIINGKVNLSGIARITESDVARLSRHVVKKGDIIYSRRGDVTRKALIQDDDVGMFCGTGCLLVRPGNKVNSKFLLYHLSTPANHEWIIRHAIGATMPNLNTKILADIPLKLPALKLQFKISEFLGSLDDKIQLNHQMNQTLEQMAQALFKSWFVDFDPVMDNALAAGNDIPDELQAKAKQRKAMQQTLPADIQQLFPDEFELNEELGWVPKGWKVNSTSDIATINSLSWTKKNAPEYVSYVDLSNTKNGHIEEVTQYQFKEAPSRARRILERHDTIIGLVRPGNRSFAYIHQENLTGSTGFAVMKPLRKYFRSYLYLHLTRIEVIDEFARLADGGAYPAIRPAVVTEFPCIIADDKIYKCFEAITNPKISKIGINNHESEQLKALRDTLLPKLISGELTLSDAEQLV